MPPGIFHCAGAVSDNLYLNYAVRWRGGDCRPGKHAARESGIGGNFRGFRPFWQLPDARRIDVRRSIIDPFETLMVRQTQNNGSIALVVAADLSASMQAAPGESNLAPILAVTQAAARSAHRAGDQFGFIGFDETVREDLLIPLTRSRGAGAEIAQRLHTTHLSGRHAGGIAALAPHLPERRSLVLLVSDFLMPISLIEEALSALSRHDVAAVVTQGLRRATFPRRGLLRLQDAESGRTRLVLMRPSVQRQWQQAQVEWRLELDRLFAYYCRPGFYVSERLDMAALGEALSAA